MTNAQSSRVTGINGTPSAHPMEKVDVRSGSVRMLLTDSLSGLKRIDANSVQVCATSPPFYLLRNYGAVSVSREDPECPRIP